MELIIVRHCETDWNTKEDRQQGHIDIPLNDHGKEQAKALALKLASFKISQIISSDLSRASETANIISATIGNVPVQLDSRLRECHFGSIQGKTKKEAQEIFKQTGCWNGYDYDFRQFCGESREQVLRRQFSLLDELLKLFRNENLLLTGHGLSLSTVLVELGYDANLLREEYRIIEYPMAK